VPGALAVNLARVRTHEMLTSPLAGRLRPAETPADHGLPYEEVTVTSPDGLRLVGWYLPSRNGAAVMAQHGYKNHRGEFLEEAAMLQRAGFGVLITSVRAHDLSEGEIISFGYWEWQDLQAWYDWLAARPEIQPGRIGALGNSMGGTLVLQHASLNPEMRAVVAHSAFSSLDDTISTSVQSLAGLPAFPFAPLMVFWGERELGFDSSEIDAKRWIGEISPRPVLLLQGGQDRLVSVDSGRLLYEAAGEPRELWFEPELGHASFDRELPLEFERRVVAFFEARLLGD
jgi:fermentation-respiration switch protein FrsA (DUF1100 family)